MVADFEVVEIIPTIQGYLISLNEEEVGVRLLGNRFV
jgi:hypothetical protein